MERSTYHNVLLCWEILAIEPNFANRGQHNGDSCGKILQINETALANTYLTWLSALSMFASNERFKKKMAAEEGASGINPEGSELNVLVEEILAKEEA